MSTIHLLAARRMRAHIVAVRSRDLVLPSRFVADGPKCSDLHLPVRSAPHQLPAVHAALAIEADVIICPPKMRPIAVAAAPQIPRHLVHIGFKIDLNAELARLPLVLRASATLPVPRRTQDDPSDKIITHKAPSVADSGLGSTTHSVHTGDKGDSPTASIHSRTTSTGVGCAAESVTDQENVECAGEPFVSDLEQSPEHEQSLEQEKMVVKVQMEPKEAHEEPSVIVPVEDEIVAKSGPCQVVLDETGGSQEMDVEDKKASGADQGLEAEDGFAAPLMLTIMPRDMATKPKVKPASFIKRLFRPSAKHPSTTMPSTAPPNVPANPVMKVTPIIPFASERPTGFQPVNVNAAAPSKLSVAGLKALAKRAASSTARALGQPFASRRAFGKLAAVGQATSRTGLRLSLLSGLPDIISDSFAVVSELGPSAPAVYRSTSAAGCVAKISAQYDKTTGMRCGGGGEEEPQAEGALYDRLTDMANLVKAAYQSLAAPIITRAIARELLGVAAAAGQSDTSLQHQLAHALAHQFACSSKAAARYALEAVLANLTLLVRTPGNPRQSSVAELATFWAPCLLEASVCGDHMADMTSMLQDVELLKVMIENAGVFLAALAAVDNFNIVDEVTA